MTPDSKPLVTIAIPTYNRADSYLSTTIEAALEQTYEPIEVLVVDNFSTDHTPQLVQSYSNDHENLQYIRQPENIGALPNFQHCLDVASGSFFLMLHDDDDIDADFVAACLDAANYDTRLGYIRTGIRTIDGEGNTVREYPNNAANLQREAYVSAWLRGKVYWYFSSSLLNTELLRSIGGFSTDFEQLIDLSIFGKLALKSDGVDITPVKASMREHDDRITTGTGMTNWIEEYARLKDILLTNASAEWGERLDEEADAFCGLLLSRYADRIPDKRKRFLAYTRIARAFGLRNIPRPLSKIVRCITPTSLETYLEQWVKAFRRTDKLGSVS